MIQRINRLRSEMKKMRIAAFFITNPTNIFYLTGLIASVGAMLVEKKRAIVFLDKRYSEMAQSRAQSGFTILDSAEMMKILKPIKSFGFESDTVTVDQRERWKTLFKNKKLVQVPDLIKGLRRFKDENEISIISRACGVSKAVLKIVPRLLKSGVSEIALAWMIESECRKRGAEAMAFETIVGFGSNTSRPHHHPTGRKFKTGDLVQVDMGAKVGGYCSDFSRIYVTGTLNSKQKKALRALIKAKKSVEGLIKPGVSIHALDRHARTMLRHDGYDEEFCHALGHGVGLEIHEGVTISTKRPDTILRKGDVITIEPGLYFAGKFGMRIEDTHIVT